MSEHNRKATNGTKRFTRLACKEEEESCARNCVLQVMIKELNAWEYYSDTYTQNTNQCPPQTCSARRYPCNLSHPSWLANCRCFSDEHPLLLYCPGIWLPLVYTWWQRTLGHPLLFLPCSLVLLCLGPLVPLSLLVLSCLVPHWSSLALWFCPAWFHFGHSLPSGPAWIRTGPPSSPFDPVLPGHSGPPSLPSGSPLSPLAFLVLRCSSKDYVHFPSSKT